MNALSADISYARLLPPAILLFGDDPARRLILAEAIARAGGRVVANAPLAQASRRLDRQASAGGVVLDLATDDGRALDILLDRVDAMGEATGRPFAIIVAPAALIDMVSARIAGSASCLLIDPGADELDVALSELLAVPEPCLADGAGASSRRLAQLSEEVGRIARTLAALSGDEAPCAPPVVMAGPSGEDAAMLRTLIKLRRLRGQHFLPVLFADPAWDILLDLAAARIEGRRVSVSSLCIAADVPPTTALRWITQMTEHGLLERRPDPTDGRRVFIALAAAAADAMASYLASARRVLAPA